MKKHLDFLIIATLLLALASPSNAQRRLRSGSRIGYRTQKMHIGIRGEVVSSFYDYSALNDETVYYLPVAWNYGLGLEWRLLDQLSVGLDAVHSTRKSSLSFSTPYLVSFTETAVTRIDFAMTEYCLDFGLPVTVYFGRTDRWADTQARPYLFIAPSACLIYGGSLQWTRMHLIDNTVLDSYELPLSKSSSCGYDYGIRMGGGVAVRQNIGRYFFLAKIGLSFYYGLHDTFSDLEKDNLLPADHYFGLGDIMHEQLGERYSRQSSLSCSIYLPLRDRLKGACQNFDKNRY